LLGKLATLLGTVATLVLVPTTAASADNGPLPDCLGLSSVLSPENCETLNRADCKSIAGSNIEDWAFTCAYSKAIFPLSTVYWTAWLPLCERVNSDQNCSDTDHQVCIVFANNNDWHDTQAFCVDVPFP
jgi:hypothetical protein